MDFIFKAMHYIKELSRLTGDFDNGNYSSWKVGTCSSIKDVLAKSGRPVYSVSCEDEGLVRMVCSYLVSRGMEEEKDKSGLIVFVYKKE